MSTLNVSGSLSSPTNTTLNISTSTNQEASSFAPSG